MLTTTGDGDLSALEETYKQINGASGIVYKLIRSFYNPQAISFAEAGIASKSEHVVHLNAIASGHYLLSGGFFEDRDRFEKFIDLLQVQRVYQRFKCRVIDRQEFQDDSCAVEGRTVFPSQNGKKESAEVNA